MTTPFQDDVANLNDEIMDMFGIPMTIGGVPVIAKFVEPLKAIYREDGKMPRPAIDIKTDDIAAIDVSSGVAVEIGTGQYVIASREPSYRGRTIINLRKSG